MTRPGPSAQARQAAIVGVRQRPARTLPNLAAARALRSLEVLVFHAASAPRLAATMGVHDRTARRLMQSLEDEGYVQSGTGTDRQRHTYSPTPRLLALAGQLAARMPLVTHGTHAVHQLNHATGLDAYLVVPSYGDVIVLASAGDHARALCRCYPPPIRPATASCSPTAGHGATHSDRTATTRPCSTPKRAPPKSAATAMQSTPTATRPRSQSRYRCTQHRSPL
jgi:hypothetical protein